MTYKLTVIVPTYKRKESIIRLLYSLNSEQKYIKELIVIEQGENNKKLITTESRGLRLDIKYYCLSEISTTKAKNYGVQKSTSDIILFLDDDVVAEKGLIKYHLQNYSDKNVAAVCGRSITVGQEIEPFRTDVGRISSLGNFSDGYSSTVKQKIDTVIGCNASWRKSVFNEIGGFDEQFTGNAMREESDLSLRAKKAGYGILFEPLALVRHMREPSGGARKTEGRMKWYFDFFSNETYFFLKHFRKILLPVFLLSHAEWSLRCMLGFGREVSVRSMLTPVLGVFDGIKKYNAYVYEHRN